MLFKMLVGYLPVSASHLMTCKDVTKEVSVESGAYSVSMQGRKEGKREQRL